MKVLLFHSLCDFPNPLSEHEVGSHSIIELVLQNATIGPIDTTNTSISPNSRPRLWASRTCNGVLRWAWWIENGSTGSIGISPFVGTGCHKRRREIQKLSSKVGYFWQSGFKTLLEVLHGHGWKIKELVGYFVSSSKIWCRFDVPQDSIHFV